MTSEVISARADKTVQQLVRLLREHSITGAPVVDGTGALVGVVSKTDIILNKIFGEGPVMDSDYHKQTEAEEDALWDDFALEDVRDLRVGDIMSPEVVTAQQDTPIEELAGIMHSHRIHRVIIVKGDRLSGIVSTTDILKAVIEKKIS